MKQQKRLQNLDVLLVALQKHKIMSLSADNQFNIQEIPHLSKENLVKKFFLILDPKLTYSAATKKAIEPHIQISLTKMHP